MKRVHFRISVDTRALKITRCQDGEVIGSTESQIGGVELCAALTDYLKTEYRIQIGRLTAEQAILTVGSAFEDDDEHTYEVRGQNIDTGLPDVITISGSEVSAAIKHVLDTIEQKILLKIQFETSNLADNEVILPVILLGGDYRYLRNLDYRLQESIRTEAGIPFHVVPEDWFRPYV